MSHHEPDQQEHWTLAGALVLRHQISQVCSELCKPLAYHSNLLIMIRILHSCIQNSLIPERSRENFPAIKWEAKDQRTMLQVTKTHRQRKGGPAPRLSELVKEQKYCTPRLYLAASAGS